MKDNEKLKILKKLKDEKLLELSLIEKEIELLTTDNNIINTDKLDKETIENINDLNKPEELIVDKSYKLDQNVNKTILKDIPGFPRYLINLNREIIHETGIPIPKKIENNKEVVKLFDEKNNEVIISVDELIDKSFN